MAEVALAWVTDRPAVTSTILGARTAEQLETNLRRPTCTSRRRRPPRSTPPATRSAADYPYGEMGAEQRSRSLAGGR